MQSRGDTSNEIVSLINDGIKLAGGHKVDISLAHALEKDKTLVDV